MKVRKPIHDNWETPIGLYQELNDKYDFDFDPCPLNHDVEEWDGLKIEWGERNFINPPYSRALKESFVKKALEESRKGKLCVLLIPVSTSTNLFHDVIKPYAEKIEFIRRRVKFRGYNSAGELVDNKCGMHDSMLVVFDGRRSK